MTSPDILCGVRQSCARSLCHRGAWGERPKSGRCAGSGSGSQASELAAGPRPTKPARLCHICRIGVEARTRKQRAGGRDFRRLPQNADLREGSHRQALTDLSASGKYPRRALRPQSPPTVLSVPFLYLSSQVSEGENVATQRSTLTPTPRPRDLETSGEELNLRTDSPTTTILGIMTVSPGSSKSICYFFLSL